jgi:predicted Na+-dependent transporter
MNLDISKAQIIGLLVTLVLPVAVGLVATRVTSAAAKAVLLLLLTAANGFLVELGSAGSGYNVANGVFYAVTGFVTAVAVHFGFLKPTGISGKAQDSLRTSGSRAAGA